MSLKIKLFVAFVAALMSASGALASTFHGSARVDAFCTSLAFKVCEGAPGELRGSIDLTIAVPLVAIGGGTIALTAWGDFNRFDEYMVVYAEHIVLGNFLNSDPTDDLFADDGYLEGTRHDYGSEYGIPKRTIRGSCNTAPDCAYQPARVGTVQLTQTDMQSLVSDGLFTLSVWLNGNVSNGPCCNHLLIDEYLSVEIAFDTVASVPAPPTAVLLGSVLLCAAWRRRFG